MSDRVEVEPSAGGDATVDLAAVLDGVPDGMIVIDAGGRCRYLNPAAGALLGRAPGELPGRPVWENLPDGLRLRLERAGDAALSSGRPGRIVAEHARRRIWLEFRLLPGDAELVILLRDVTEEQRAHDELVEHLDRNFEAERIIGFGVWRWEISTGRVRWSDQLHRIYGLQPGEFAGTVEAFLAYVHPEDRDRIWANIARSIETMDPFVFEERITRPDGETRVLLSKGRVVTDAGGKPEALVGVCHDVTDRARVEHALGASDRRMRAIMEHSPSIISVKDLSGRYLMSNAESGRILGMAAEEIIGKHCEDIFPREIAEAQRAADRRAASEGGSVSDELVLMRNGEPRRYMTSTFVLPDEDGFPLETCTIATDVTERHDYESSRRRRLECADEIASALDEHRMLAYGQPIIDLSNGRQNATELLVRMRTTGENAEVLLPAHFLPDAERFGLIQLIDVWMVRQATRLPGSAPLQINLSAVTMCDTEARDEIVAVLEAAPQSARRIVFEITETAATTYLEAAAAFAHEIARLGGRLALDDFGTGFGSFTYLRTLPLSCLKIDASFVQGMADSLDDRRVVKSIIGIAEQFDLATIAEGVENEVTLELLRELGADYAQGYHLGRPAPLTGEGR
ncbi:MAG TPA: EAL domain-containing protein [Solirubrobacteraceae bacterium]|nr:EAL domain-containing protein [Solirubrobacteraceae bacterium]